MVIFGASGDLAKRKLMPALYSLFCDKRLTGGFNILGVGRTVYTDESYRSYIMEELQRFVKPQEQNATLMASFVSHLSYVSMDPAKAEGYPLLLFSNTALALRSRSFAFEGIRIKLSSIAYYHRKAFRLRS